jgi:alkylation response protein AidB-like acyl-CoA dehydrogenase
LRPSDWTPCPVSGSVRPTRAPPEQVGSADAIFELTVGYTKVRHQFGRPIGSFQALKHRMADLHVLLEAARSAAYAAGDGSLHPSAAKAYCSEAFQTIAGEAIQLHGGIAITWEHDAHLYFKRAHGSAALFGAPREHLRRLDEESP